MITILSIDDSRAVHAYLDDCLRGSAVKIMHIYSGTEGIDLASRGGIDLVLLDWEMPGLTGPEVLSALRGSGCSVPVIMLTSKSEPEGILKMLEIGANEYIMKPFTPDILRAKIEEVTGKPVSAHVAE